MRWRLQLWHMLAIFVLTALLLVLFYRHEKVVQLELLDDALQLPLLRVTPYYFGARRHEQAMDHHRERYSKTLGEPERDAPYVDHSYRELPRYKGKDPARAIADEAITELEENGFFIVIWAAEGGTLYATAGAPVHHEPPELDPFMARPLLVSHGGHREALFRNPPGDVILIGYSYENFAADLAGFRNTLIAGGVVCVVGFGVLGWFLNMRSLKPIQVMSEAAQTIAQGDLSHRIDVGQRRNELGSLADTLNITFERLEAALQRQMQFTADASHELRTPLTTILNELSWALAQVRSSEDYVDSLQTCKMTANHMRSLIESLLELAKIDSGNSELQIEVHSIGELVGETAESLRPIAEQRKVELETKLSSETVYCDATQIRQVVINLVSNAIHHTPIGSTVWVVTELRGDQHVVSVSDDGSGITETHIPFIFDRFYRSGQSRAKANGSGLGLAISKAIAVAHGGDLTVTSREDEGSTFTLTLPRRA